MSDVVVDNSSIWFPVLKAIQLANWCDVAAVALVCYDSILMFPREAEYIWRKRWSFTSAFYVIVRYLGIALSLSFWAFNANVPMSPSLKKNTFPYPRCVGLDRFVNFGALVDTIVGQVLMFLRIYAMYLGSKIVFAILIAMLLARIALGLAVSIIIFGPHSGISATEFSLSGIYVCGPSVNTDSSLPLGWDILAIIVNALLFLLAVGRFFRHTLDMRQMGHAWTFTDLMGVLVRDSIVYFLLNLLSTIFLMIAAWGVPNNTFFGIVSAYTQNESSVLIPRLVITFRENYELEGQHDGDAGQKSAKSEGMVFERRSTVTDDFELDRVQSTSVQPPRVEESA